MNKPVSQTYGDMGKKLDDYERIEDLVVSLEGLVRKGCLGGRVSDRLKELLPKILSKECLFAIDKCGIKDKILIVEGE